MPWAVCFLIVFLFASRNSPELAGAVLADILTGASSPRFGLLISPT